MSTWMARLAGVGAIWAVVVVPMILLGMGPRPVLLALIAAGLAATVFCAVDLLATAEPVRWPRPMRSPPRPLEDPRANQLLRMIEAAPDDPKRAAALRAVLAGLSVGPEGDAGDPVADAAADERPLRHAEIDQMVRRIETDGPQ